MAMCTHRGQLLHIVIWSSEGSQADLLRELSKGLVTEQRDMAQHLVTDIRFRSVHGPRAVSDVLGGVEDSESQPSKEITRREEPCWG